MAIKYPENIDFSWKDERLDYEVFFDQMYQAYLIEKEMYRENNTVSKSDYFEQNQEFLIKKYIEVCNDI